MTIYEATQEDWDDFFKPEHAPKTAFDSVDQDDEWLCVVSQHGSIPFQQANQRLDEQTEKQTSTPIGFIFDR
jgi:hypothetical protein